jgi:hypothetical protein
LPTSLTNLTPKVNHIVSDTQPLLLAKQVDIYVRYYKLLSIFFTEFVAWVCLDFYHYY